MRWRKMTVVQVEKDEVRRGGKEGGNRSRRGREVEEQEAKEAEKRQQ